MVVDSVFGSGSGVALRKESVDRNLISVVASVAGYVALRKESVDRNSEINTRGSEKMVALRKESVDRNDVIRPAIDVFLAVALRKESVDRNSTEPASFRAYITSLSARRAWIEILFGRC